MKKMKQVMVEKDAIVTRGLQRCSGGIRRHGMVMRVKRTKQRKSAEVISALADMVFFIANKLLSAKVLT